MTESGNRVLLSARKQAHVAANSYPRLVLRDLLESAWIGLGTASATRGIADVDHAWCRCGDRGGWFGHVFGSHTGSRSVGNNVVGREDSWGELGIGITVEDERRRVVFVVTSTKVPTSTSSDGCVSGTNGPMPKLATPPEGGGGGGGLCRLCSEDDVDQGTGSL